MFTRLYVPVYALTLLLSALLLFAVQPMFSKMILPLLGGAPQVWNTAMMVFQLLLLSGYAYAHGTSRFLPVRIQAVLHIVLLAIFLTVLPIAIPTDWSPPDTQDPTLWQISLMAVTVGGPFFLLSGSAPMLQHWFAKTDHAHADNPYFLYGASNLGSMSALLAYPFFIEPLLDTAQQSYVWMIGYGGLMAMMLLSALLVWRAAGASSQKSIDQTAHEPITMKRRLTWLVLAAVPSSLLLGVTSFITTDIASVPLLWIIPLALYVSTFIIVFARRPIISRERAMILFGAVLAVTMMSMIRFSGHNFFIMGMHYLLFFTAALACHSELAALRPGTSRLTEFYLFMSLGGAIGGILNALIAPKFFILPLEYAAALALACGLRYASGTLKISTQRMKTAEMIATAVVILCGILAFIFDMDRLLER